MLSLSKKYVCCMTANVLVCDASPHSSNNTKSVGFAWQQLPDETFHAGPLSPRANKVVGHRECDSFLTQVIVLCATKC